MKTSIIINGIEFILQENHLYKPGNFEAKYKVLYFNEFYDSWCFLYMRRRSTVIIYRLTFKNCPDESLGIKTKRRKASAITALSRQIAQVNKAKFVQSVKFEKVAYTTPFANLVRRFVV